MDMKSDLFSFALALTMTALLGAGAMPSCLAQAATYTATSTATSDSESQSSPQSQFSGQFFAGVSEAELAQVFSRFQSCFVMLDLKRSKFHKINAELCSTRFSPCSTFKIFNSLVGLDTGVAKSERQVFAKKSESGLEEAQTMQAAMTNSLVWYYQAMAEKIGMARMKHYLKKVPYGNADATSGGGITRFWLGDSLKISPDEQVRFVADLVEDRLPFKTRSMAIVRGMMRLSENDKGILYGKTGSMMKDGKNELGWFVGYLVKPHGTYVFCTLIKAKDTSLDAGTPEDLQKQEDESNKAWGKQARKLTEEALSKLGLW
jgi:bla regulator protein BlaR1